MSPQRQTSASTSYSAQIHKTTLQLQGQQVTVLIKASKRKSLRLSVNHAGEIEVKIPLRCPQYEVMAFLTRHNQWLEDRLAQFQQVQQVQKQQMQYLGNSYRFQRSAQSHKQPVLMDAVCYYPSAWTEQQLLEKVDSWQRAQAKDLYQQLIDRWWPQFSQGALIGRPVLRVKKMRSRWGSLSSKGYINLNLKLIELDPQLIEMVVVHELCHSHYFDHSANFYRLMAEKLPHYKQLEAQLRTVEKGCAY